MLTWIIYIQKLYCWYPLMVPSYRNITSWINSARSSIFFHKTSTSSIFSHKTSTIYHFKLKKAYFHNETYSYMLNAEIWKSLPRQQNYPAVLYRPIARDEKKMTAKWNTENDWVMKYLWFPPSLLMVVWIMIVIPYMDMLFHNPIFLLHLGL